MNKSFPNIVCTEEVLGGSPRIAGRRLAVGDVVSLVNSYGTFEEVKQDFELRTDEIQQALVYCSTLQCQKDRPRVFCHNCSLRTEQEGPVDLCFLEEDKTLDGSPIVRDGDSIYFGTLHQYVKERRGADWWVQATELLMDHKDQWNQP